jgi:membrane associated rhomboid family serine protease
MIYRRVRATSRFRAWDAVSVLRTFLPQGLTHAAGSGFIRFLLRLNPADWIKTQLSPQTVVRSVPMNWFRLLFRCKVTVLLVALNLIVFLMTTDEHGHLNPGIEQAWSYSGDLLRLHPLQALGLSPFLHWSLTHLNTNLVMLIFFAGGLEYLAGSGIMALCYLIPMIFSNPLTSLLFAIPQEIDVGASLGIFGCAGALVWYFKRRYWLVWDL